MIIPLKLLIKALYATTPSLRDSIFERVAAAETDSECRRAATYGVSRQASWESVAATLQQKTVFLLGSGSSIKMLDELQLSVVGRKASIALNMWPRYHSFVANYYLVETSYPPLWKALERVVGHPRFCGILASQFLDYEHLRASKKIHFVPSTLAKNTYWYTTLPSLGITKAAYGESIRSLLCARVNFDGVMSGPKSTSIERAMVLVALAGAREIVLCGIDLRGTYFWETQNHNRPHPTNAGLRFTRSAKSRIILLAQLLKAISGTDVWLANAAGELAGAIPTYNWPTRSRAEPSA